MQHLKWSKESKLFHVFFYIVFQLLSIDANDKDENESPTSDMTDLSVRPHRFSFLIDKMGGGTFESISIMNVLHPVVGCKEN